MIKTQEDCQVSMHSNIHYWIFDHLICAEHPPHHGYYEGPPIHTVTVFANPFLEDKPNLDDPEVHVVFPGDEAPSEGSQWHTLYFSPGVHDIGASFHVHANKSYYIPGEAVVYGTMNNNKNEDDGEGILIYGHGTLSGDRLPHPNYANVSENEHWRYHGINIEGIFLGVTQFRILT